MADQPSGEGRGPMNTSGTHYPPMPPGYSAPPAAPSPSVRSSILGRIVTAVVGMVVTLSLGLNLYFMLYFALSMPQGPYERVQTPGDRAQRIVIVPIEGPISDFSSDFVRRSLQALRENRPKAVIVRIDSGGGGVGASDRIYHELTRFREQTGVPIVASLGSYAASGGYYVATPAEHIVAEPTCVTGSIGVIANVLTFPGLLDKIGVEPEVIVAPDSPRKDEANDVTRPWTDKDRTVVRDLLGHMHERFIETVHAGRKSQMSVEEVRSAADGRIFTADEAKDVKLIDGIGYLDAAIDHAKSLAQIDPETQPHVTRMQPAAGLGLLGALIGGKTPQRTQMTMDADVIHRTLSELTRPRLEYR